MSDDFLIDVDDLTRRMDGAMSALKSEFASLRTGRASSSMLDPIMVDAYGQRTPINQVGTVNVPEPRMVTINVWDKSQVDMVEKAIRESGLGINPQTNGGANNNTPPVHQQPQPTTPSTSNASPDAAIPASATTIGSPITNETTSGGGRQGSRDGAWATYGPRVFLGLSLIHI